MATEKQRMTIDAFEAELFELGGSDEPLKMILYGDSGCGKTHMAAGIPGHNLWLTGEPGFRTAERLEAKGKRRAIRDSASALAAIEYLEEGNWSKYGMVIVDGLSTMNKRFILHYAAEAFDANPAKRVHRNLPDKPDYFNAQNFISDWTARFVDLPIPVLFTAHAMRPEGDDGEPMVYPSIQGKGYEVANFVSGLMGVVGYMSTVTPKTGAKKGEQIKRILWQEYRDPKTDTKYFAKDQYGALPRWTDNATMPEILSTLGVQIEDTMPNKVLAKKPTRRGRAA